MISNSNGWRAWRMSRSLHTTYLLCRCQERVGKCWPLQNTKLFVPTQIFIYVLVFKLQSNSFVSVETSLPRFYLVFILMILSLNMAEILLKYGWNIARWMLSNNQSINLRSWTISTTFTPSISLTWVFNIYWSRLIPPLVIEVPVPSQKSEGSCMCVLGVLKCLYQARKVRDHVFVC